MIPSEMGEEGGLCATDEAAAVVVERIYPE